MTKCSICSKVGIRAKFYFKLGGVPFCPTCWKKLNDNQVQEYRESKELEKDK